MEQLKFIFEPVSLQVGDTLRVSKVAWKISLTNEIGFATKLPEESTEVIVHACAFIPLAGIGHSALKGIIHYRNGELLFYRQNHFGHACREPLYLSRFWDGDIITITSTPSRHPSSIQNTQMPCLTTQ